MDLFHTLHDNKGKNKIMMMKQAVFFGLSVMLSTTPFSLAFLIVPPRPPTVLVLVSSRVRRTEQRQKQTRLSQSKNDDASCASSTILPENELFFFMEDPSVSNNDDLQLFAVHGPEMKQAMRQKGWKQVQVNCVSSLDDLPATKGKGETAKDDSTYSDRSEMDAALLQAMQEFYKTKEERSQALKNACEAGACIQRTKAMCRAAADSTWGERNIKVLLQLGGSVHDRDAYGSTPLHIAAVFFNADAVEILIQKGADLEAKDDDGLTPKMTFEDSVERRMEMVQEFGMPLTAADREREARIRSLLLNE
jgi:hypothetical protein